MNVINFIVQNWDFVLLIVVAVAAIIFAIFKGNKSVVMRMLYSLVTEAEQIYGAGTGSLKLAAVIDAIYPSLPAVIKLFITDETLVRWVETALETAKEAWKKNAALGEYVKKPTKGAQNDAQSVETAEGGQEYPAEEAPRKTANTEPTEGQTDAAEETAPQDPAAEPAEPEGEVLSLDSIDDLVLPGDVDPGEEQQSQRWRITDDGCADWALKKIKLERDEHDRIVALAQQEIARLTDQIAKADRRYEQNTSFLTSMLAEFFETVPHKKTKTGTESYRLLNGQLVKKPAGIKLQPDDEKLVAWLRAAGREDLIKVETKAMWGELKKQLEMVGTVAMMPDTGEIIEGIDVVEVPAAFSVKF